MLYLNDMILYDSQNTDSKKEYYYQEETRHCAVDKNLDFTSPWL